MRYLTVVAMLLLVATGARAQEMKVGIVDMQRALLETKDGKTAKTELSKKSEQYEAELKGMQAEIEKIRLELDKQATFLSEDARNEKEKVVQKKIKEFQSRYREAQDELKQRESELIKKMLQRLEKIVIRIGETEKFTMIMDKTSGVYYFDKKVDITDALIAKANEEEKK